MSNAALIRPVLEACGLSYSCGDKEILSSINLSLYPGELVGLVGANGSGKTSLMRHLSGFLQAASGTVLLEGQPMAHWGNRERARRLAFIPQKQSTEFPFTVAELVAMGRYPYRSWLTGHDPAGSLVVRRALERTGVAELAERSIATLSGGELQLVVFARALAQQTDILLLDEPSASLDMGHEHAMFSMMRRLAREGLSVCTVIHNLNTAAEYCDRLVLLHEGRVVAEGLPSAVLTAQTVERYFGAQVRIGQNEASGSIMLQHIPDRQTNSGKRVHIIGGAGSAVAITRSLYRAGFRLSGGIAHALDSDAVLWESLGIPAVVVPAFSHVDSKAYERALAMAADADICILCDFPFGPGNSRNLDLACAARQLVIIDGPVAASLDRGHTSTAPADTACARAFYGHSAERQQQLAAQWDDLLAAKHVQRIAVHDDLSSLLSLLAAD